MTWRIFKNRCKKAFKSLTIWFNTTGAALLAVLIVEPSIVEYLNANDLSMVLVAGNILLRFKTNSDLADK